MAEEGKVSFNVLTREKDVQAVQAAIREAEEKLGKSSEAKVEESSRYKFPGIAALIVTVATAFATSFATRFGVSFANWLARKLGLDESKGEKVTESG